MPTRQTLPIALVLAALSQFARAQPPKPVVLVFDIADIVEYQEQDVPSQQFATIPNVTTSNLPGNFSTDTGIGDIVAVNGKPVKGVYAARARNLNISPTPAAEVGAGWGIADVRHVSLREEVFEILQADGTPIGSIMTFGLNSGTPPPGSPSVQKASNITVMGGTGAFLGARGIAGGAGGNTRAASFAEDPANRRINGGGRFSRAVTLFPLSTPQIVTVSHADFSPVTSASPARAGEVLIVKASGLGPTVPGVEPGQPFPLDAPQTVNSPLDVTLNGLAADVVNKIGWPGLLDTYRVDFRVPAGPTTGTVTIQLTVAWMPAPPVSIPAQ